MIQLNYTEIENENENENNRITKVTNPYFSTNTYPHSNSSIKSKKQGISYDDILSSLNLKVNHGKLEYIEPTIPSSNNSSFYTSQTQPIKKVQVKPTTTTHSAPPQYSYIHNKYFKNYKESSATYQEVKPMTREEYKRKIIQQYIARKLAQKRVNQIKSKKLLFSAQQPVIISQSPNNANLNKLFHLLK